ncbi:hypothetical protein [Muricoccus aerilatus]|uniref:hypothetical protein n=1 Tax=Muricoccus aerilatus TaxID=452982 RepID=UPI0012EB47CA|nr:hypothetical protein [Roseomonas aerilata]
MPTNTLTFSGNSAASTEASAPFEGDVQLPSRIKLAGAERAASIVSNMQTHRIMLLRSASAELTPRPLLYIGMNSSQPSSLPTVALRNSSGSLSSTTLDYYSRVDEQLISLASTDEDEPIEQGAIDTARSLLADAKQLQLAPPELSWHGGDAVVMIWSLQDTTCALTVTDGHVGFVVRRDRKTIRKSNSLALHSFKLLEMG